ncbi:hypothetical protein ACFX12_005378 [Malus domestica]
MSEEQTYVEPAAQYEIETAAEPGVRARRVLTLLRSIYPRLPPQFDEREGGGRIELCGNGRNNRRSCIEDGVRTKEPLLSLEEVDDPRTG